MVNEHNVEYWTETNPHVAIETFMKSPKLNAWCAMLKNHLINPSFFEDDAVDGENYLLMLQNFFITEIRKLHNLRSVVVQEGSTPPHFSIGVRQYLGNHFPARWIGRGDSTW